MMKFEKNIEERKVLVKRLGELTGISPYYTKVPRCAYEIGDYTVERDGSLTVEEDAADLGILAALKNEGLIKDAEGILEAQRKNQGRQRKQQRQILSRTANTSQRFGKRQPPRRERNRWTW